MTKKRELENKKLCSICGEEADGNWFMVATCKDDIYNNEISAEFYCPLDLCKKHMKYYNRIVVSNVKYVRERYDGYYEKEQNELILKIHELSEEGEY